MDFTLTPEVEALRLRTRAFVEEHVIPLESDPANYDAHENLRLDLARALYDKSKAAGLWAPQSPKEFGGMALPITARALVYHGAQPAKCGAAGV